MTESHCHNLSLTESAEGGDCPYCKILRDIRRRSKGDKRRTKSFTASVMSKIIDYDLINGHLEDLPKLVKSKISQGWQPLGAPVATGRYDDPEDGGERYYIQAMIKIT